MKPTHVKGYPRAIMPGKSTKADIYLELEDVEGQQGRPKAWFAKVDLGRLGWTARWKRHMGEIRYVYVKKLERDAKNPQTKQ